MRPALMARELAFFGNPFVVLVPVLYAVKRHAVIRWEKAQNFIWSAGCTSHRRSP
jgi:hypothetical protein